MLVKKGKICLFCLPLGNVGNRKYGSGHLFPDRLGCEAITGMRGSLGNVPGTGELTAEAVIFSLDRTLFGRRFFLNRELV